MRARLHSPRVRCSPLDFTFGEAPCTAVGEQLAGRAVGTDSLAAAHPCGAVCPTELAAFSDSYDEFADLGAEVGPDDEGEGLAACGA